MTRDEQIEKEAHRVSYNGDEYSSFIQGAEWADEHPSVDTVKKIICYALRFTNIMLVDDLEKGIEWESLIKKSNGGITYDKRRKRFVTC